MHFRATALSLGARGESGMTLREVMREVLFVPETKLAVELLQEFQQRRRQMAIVVDEFGTTVGLVTAEDALEQVVGELEDEFDVSTRASMLSAGAFSGGLVVLDGNTTLRDLTTQLGWPFPRLPGVETLAGFLLDELGHIPVVGERVTHAGRIFRVAEMAGRRICASRGGGAEAGSGRARDRRRRAGGFSVSSGLRAAGKRLLVTLPVLWVVVTVVFLLIHLVPGDPIVANAG